MKKLCVLIVVVLFFISFIASACNHKPKANMVQAKRRFAQYTNVNTTQNSGGVIDLSEGPKLNYSMDLGPQNLNFDIKIVDPY